MRRYMTFGLCVLAAVAFGAGRLWSAEPDDESAPERTERAKLPPGQVAVVNDEPITEAQFQSWIVKRMGPRRYTQLNSLIARVLLKQAAEKAGVRIDPAEVQKIYDDQLARIKAERPDSSVEASLKYLGVTKDDLREDIIYNLRLRRLVKDNYDIEATPDDVRELYQARYGPRYFVQQIVVKNGADAAKIVEKLVRGADFAVAARRYSEDMASRAFAGFINGGPITAGDLAPGLEDVVLKLKPAEISPVKSFGGRYYIFRMVEKIPPAEDVKLDDVKAKLKEEVVDRKVMEYARDYLLKLYKQSKVRVSSDF